MELVPIPSITEVSIILYDFLVLIYVSKVPGSSGRVIRVYRKREYFTT